MTEEIPEYRVMETCFFAPHLVHPGSKIRTLAEPHNGLAPLNDSAKAALELWYEKEADEYDERFKKTGNKIFPNRKWKFLAEAGQSTEPAHEVEILSLPPADLAGTLSLAEAQFARQPTDARPGPALSFDEQTAIMDSAPRPKKVA